MNTRATDSPNDGRINGYKCPRCGTIAYTIDVHDGVTPAFMKCKAVGGCLGVAASLLYMIPADHPEPSWEWYRPTKAVARRQDKRAPGSFEHWRNGGLSLRPRGMTEGQSIGRGIRVGQNAVVGR